MEYEFRFDKINSNALHIFKNGKYIKSIACPPIEKGCDVINFSNEKGNYIFNFDGLLLFTTINDRKLFYKGELIAETKRN